VTSQFEQHLRAVLDLPLGGTGVLGQWAVMKNILGGENQDLYSAFPAALAADAEAKVHTYGKTVRPGRKIGHVNLVGAPGSDPEELRRRAARVAAVVRDGVPAAQERDPAKETA
jgi:5-(carboxyamino)imidazole ribonucleotide synthase